MHGANALCILFVLLSICTTFIKYRLYSSNKKVCFLCIFFNFPLPLHAIMKIDILSEAEVASLKQIIDESDNIVICCHKSPDGDAMGSSLAMCEYLRIIGKQARVVVPDAYPDFLQWLPGTEAVLRYDKHPEDGDAALSKADLVFCLDFNTTSRVDEMQASLEASTAHKVLIDHHLDPDIKTDITVSHPEMSSTSEMVFRVICQLGGFEQMTKACAVSIYCGMMTDTGGFTYNSNSPEIFYIISQLLTKHIDKDKIYRNVFNNYSQMAMRLRGYLIYKKLTVIDDLHASFFTISRADMKRFRFIKGDAEGLVNEPLRIKGMRLSISLREDDRRDNTVWVSLRSVDSFPCNKMAEKFFNGGGHLNASGGRLNCSLEEAVTITRKAIEDFAELLR